MPIFCNIYINKKLKSNTITNVKKYPYKQIQYYLWLQMKISRTSRLKLVQPQSKVTFIFSAGESIAPSVLRWDISVCIKKLFMVFFYWLANFVNKQKGTLYVYTLNMYGASI